MARHSHWHNIQLTKGKADAKKAQSFAKLARAITIAAKESGGDPSFNFKLRMAVDAAKSVSMPKDNIDRAIQRAVGGGDGVELKEVVYEGFGPGGVAMLIQCVTDNSTRSVAEVKRIASRHLGSIGAPGSVMWMFEKKGVVMLDPSAVKDREAFELALIEGGVQDIRWESAGVQVIGEVKDLKAILSAVEKIGLTPVGSGIEYVAKDSVSVEDTEVKRQLDELVEAFEDNDDVDAVYTNDA